LPFDSCVFTFRRLRMYFLLYERVAFRTGLSPAQIGERLSPEIDQTRGFRLGMPKLPWLPGRIDESLLGKNASKPLESGPAFKFSFIEKGGSFSPVIVGRLFADERGTRVVLTFHMHLLIVAFFLFCTYHLMIIRSAFPRGLACAIWLMLLIAFNQDRIKAKRMLFELLEGTSA
jgi:hypothetical protein